MKRIELPHPLNAQEKFLYAISERLDILIDLLKPDEKEAKSAPVVEEAAVEPAAKPTQRKRKV